LDAVAEPFSLAQSMFRMHIASALSFSFSPRCRPSIWRGLFFWAYGKVGKPRLGYVVTKRTGRVLSVKRKSNAAKYELQGEPQRLLFLSDPVTTLQHPNTSESETAKHADSLLHF
jgi:hypothetical protein